MNHTLKRVNLNEDMYEFTCEDCSYTAFTQVDPETNIPDLKNLIVTDPGDIYAVHAYITFAKFSPDITFDADIELFKPDVKFNDMLESRVIPKYPNPAYQKIDILQNYDLTLFDFISKDEEE